MADETARPHTGWRTLRNLLLKAAGLFVILNLLFAWLNPLPALARLSAYNHLFPGRARLPFGEDPQRSYNLSVLQIEALFASHEISAGPKPPDEFRVFFFGDSSVWGFHLTADQTVAAALDHLGLKAADGRRIRIYNFGYPTLSLAKDLLLLDYASRYQPDLIVWWVTLESFPRTLQLDSPIVQYNPGPMRLLIQGCGLKLDPNDPRFVDPSLWDRTIVGRRRDMADLVRLQLYGPMWAATSIDHFIPAEAASPAVDLPADTVFHGFSRGSLRPDDLAFDVLQAGAKSAGRAPLLIVNQPVFISHGTNSDIRYNAFYPRWAYDEYRAWLLAFTEGQGLSYLDLWDAVPSGSFTDNAIHYSAPAAQELAARLAGTVVQLADAPPGRPGTGNGCRAGM
jgi:hypothetical protein